MLDLDLCQDRGVRLRKFQWRSIGRLSDVDLRSTLLIRPDARNSKEFRILTGSESATTRVLYSILRKTKLSTSTSILWRCSPGDSKPEEMITNVQAGMAFS